MWFMSFDCHIWTVFCGYVKAQVYANKPATLETLRINIEQSLLTYESIYMKN